MTFGSMEYNLPWQKEQAIRSLPERDLVILNRLIYNFKSPVSGERCESLTFL